MYNVPYVNNYRDPNNTQPIQNIFTNHVLKTEAGEISGGTK